MPPVLCWGTAGRSARVVRERLAVLRDLLANQESPADSTYLGHRPCRADVRRSRSERLLRPLVGRVAVTRVKS